MTFFEGTSKSYGERTGSENVNYQLCYQFAGQFCVFGGCQKVIIQIIDFLHRIWGNHVEHQALGNRTGHIMLSLIKQQQVWFWCFLNQVTYFLLTWTASRCLTVCLSVFGLVGSSFQGLLSETNEFCHIWKPDSLEVSFSCYIHLFLPSFKKNMSKI